MNFVHIVQSFLLALLLMLGAVPAAAQVSGEARAAWGFDRSDLVPRPGVRFGVLANGMRYAIMRSASPPGALSMRLRFAVGSAAEGADERGMAHLIEHLAFEGTRRFPGRGLQRRLARSGLARWRGFNAFTEYRQTVYRLNLARADAAALETGLALMRDIAGGLVFSREHLARAKAVVLAEIEARDAAEDRVTSALNAFLMPGTALARGPVAGTAEAVRRVEPAALRRLYGRHFAPARATLVVVGDIDPDAVEARITAGFGSWRARGPTAAMPAEAPILPARPSETRLFVDPGAATRVTIASVAPLGRAADAAAPRDQAFLQHLASEMLTRRLARLAGAAEAPFRSGDAAIYDHFGTARLARVEVAARDRDWRSALQSGRQELQRALQGFTQAELDEQLAATRASLARHAGPRTNAALADAIVDSLGNGTIFTAPQDASAAAAYLARVTLANVNAAFRAAWAQPGRLVFIAHHEPVDETAIAEALR